MPCNLILQGKHFDVDAFIELTGITPYEITRKGEQQDASPLRTKTMHLSTLHYIVSEADFADHKTQIADALAFFQKHGEQFAKHVSAAGIEHTFLDFGMDTHIRNRLYKTFDFPAELLKYLADMK